MELDKLLINKTNLIKRYIYIHNYDFVVRYSQGTQLKK